MIKIGRSNRERRKRPESGVDVGMVSSASLKAFGLTPESGRRAGIGSVATMDDPAAG